MKKSVLMAAAVCGICMINSCSQKETIFSQTGTFSVSFEASREGASSFVNPYTKGLDVQITDNGETITSSWVAGETVLVMSNPSTPADYANAKPEDIMKPVGVLTATTSGPVTTLVGQLSGTFYAGQSLFLTYQHRPDLVYDYTGQDGTLETIARKYDYAESTYHIYGFNGSTISGTYQPYFHAYQAIVKFILKDESGNPLNASRLEISTVNSPGHFITLFEPLKVDGEKLLEYMSSIPTGPSAFPAPEDNPYLACLHTGAVVINPTAPTDVIYAALTGDMNGTGILAGVQDATIKLTATAGGETYTYQKENVTFMYENFYTVEVNMTKQ